MKNINIASTNALGQALRLARDERALTQEQLGSKVGIDQSTISSVENGNPGTRIDTIFHLLAALDLEIVLQPRTSPKSLKGKERW